ncbi:Acetyltransferase YpeA [compost metagenome]
MNIRPFRMEDYHRAYELWSRTPGMGLSDSDSEDGIRSFLERNPGLSFVAGKEDGDVLGTVLAGHDGRRGFLYHLAVSTTCRGQGIGGRLVQSALAALHSQNIVKCHIMVLDHNELGQAFWSGQGWLRRDNILLYSQNLNDQ